MLSLAVHNYLSEVKGLPFFYAVGDENYISTLEELKQLGLDEIKISSFCNKPDKFPSLDEVIDFFRTADVDYKTNRYVLVGLGEYLALRGEEEAQKALRKLKNTTLGNAHVVVLLRSIENQMERISAEDIRLVQQQRYCHERGNNSQVSVVNLISSVNIGLVNADGIKQLLEQLEKGHCGKLYVKTALDLSKSLYPIAEIKEPFDAIKILNKDFPLCSDDGSNDQWSRLLIDLNANGNSLSCVFEKHGFERDFESDLTNKALGVEYKNWLYYLSLKYYRNNITNSYLKLVVDSTTNFSSLRENILIAITHISHTARGFSQMYLERKTLLRDFPESDIAIFVHKNEIDPAESIYRLTDNTKLEKKAIIRWVSANGNIPEIASIYPALHCYLKSYKFSCGDLSSDLSYYFEKYKLQKISNTVDVEFSNKVSEFSRKYTRLDTRANAISAITDKKSAYLYWIDALGVEYMSYFIEVAKKKGLRISVSIARADLPTITSVNKGFFEEWVGKKKKEERLDEVKHKEKGGYDNTMCSAPIHLAEELEIIDNAINFAATELALHNCKRFIIASDHGASRLAVLQNHEEKYETDTKGEHSGRCCKYFAGCDVKNAIVEDGYIVLTDYGRFKGSRAANVEVHGGASLEEIVVPIITLTLGKDITSEIKVLDGDKIFINRKTGTLVKLYISDVESTRDVKLIVNNEVCNALYIDSTHYNFTISSIKKAKKYTAEVYEGDSLIGCLTFTVKSPIGSSNSDFDDLF